MGVLDASRSRPVMCWKQYCGFSNTGAQWHMLPQKLSELQNCGVLTLSNLVLQRDFASGFDGRCQRAS